MSVPASWRQKLALRSTIEDLIQGLWEDGRKH
jgi:hypothetical protein